MDIDCAFISPGLRKVCALRALSQFDPWVCVLSLIPSGTMVCAEWALSLGSGDSSSSG